jgi:hypothetical protein
VPSRSTGTSFANPQGVSRGVAYLLLDSAALPTRPAIVPLVDDGEMHHVCVVLGGAPGGGTGIG